MGYNIHYQPSRKYPPLSQDIITKIKTIIPNGVSTREVDRINYSKDYMPIALRWFIDGKLAALPDCIIWPETPQQIAKILQLAQQHTIPITPYGDGSGVVGGAIPIQGGIILDLKRMDTILEINATNLSTTVQPGINGMNLERSLNREGYTLGHIPQSIYCSSLGGWIACRAAGQFSTKYGKIEDMVLALQAVLPDGTIITSKPLPRTATGPEVEKLLIGAEGRLGIITQATLKIWPTPETRAYQSYLFTHISDALNAVRHIMRKNVYPAVIRIYDQNETLRHFYHHPEIKDHCMLILLMEGAQELVNLEQTISQKICTQFHGSPLGEEPVHHWLNTRFNVKESSEYTPRGFIFDTVEMTISWSDALQLYTAEIAAMRNIKGVVVASAHASHFYPQGICFYFTFGGLPPKKTDPFEFYQSIWDTIIETCLKNKGAISHHHGIGLLRAKWLPQELDGRMELFTQIQHLLDPHHIMNPGKMGVNP